MDKLIPLFLGLYYAIGVLLAFNIKLRYSSIGEASFFKFFLIPLCWGMAVYFDGKTKKQFLGGDYL